MILYKFNVARTREWMFYDVLGKMLAHTEYEEESSTYTHTLTTGEGEEKKGKSVMKMWIWKNDCDMLN